MTTKELLDTWYGRIQVTQAAHYASAAKFSRFNNRVGVPSIILSAVIATSIFATLRIQPDLWVKVVVGVASVFSAILTSLQTFFSYSSRAEKHKLAAAKYGIVGRNIEHILSLHQTDLPNDAVEQIRKELDNLSLNSPDITGSLPTDIATAWDKYKIDHILKSEYKNN